MRQTDCVARRDSATDRTVQQQDRDEKLVSWYFEPSQPLGIISGLEETSIKRHVERTNKAEIRPEEQSEKTESCR